MDTKFNQRKINALQGKLARLARNHCANYGDGDTCPLQRCDLCVVAIKTDTMTGNVCAYFMRHVLPTDADLYADYISYLPDNYPLQKSRRRNIKACAKCGDQFTAGSNSAKYCKHCSKVVKRAQTVASNRKRRA